MTTAKSDVTLIYYSASNGKKGHYQYWFNGKEWEWEALGNNGSAPTRQEAVEQAKRWIRGE